MSTLRHFPEPRPAHGGLAAEGALNLLGRPELDPLVVLIREAAQNSWDARRQESGPVRFSIDLRRAGAASRKALTESVFSDLPPRGLGLQGETVAELADALADDNLHLLTLTDSGTKGLGGPIRADMPAPDGEPTDFVDLVFNIGQPPDREFGGGTYGFGKTISYLVSKCRTVVLHTVVERHGELEHRFIAQAVGNQYSHNHQNFTGRHWWGSATADGIEPVTGQAAESLASMLGLPDLGARGGGTSLLIVAPNLSQRDSQQATTFMANALSWNFWPKMTRDGRRPPAMSFDVVCDGEQVEVPSPDTTPPLNAFADALRAVRDCEAGRRKPSDFPTFKIFELRSQRPKASLGWLALHPVTVKSRLELDEGFDDEGDPTTAASLIGPSHHVALMRRAELVVRYRPGPELSNPAVEWAGVFKASEAADQAFAEAEPPTHDDWHSNLVSGSWHRRYVNIAMRQIKEAVSGAFGSTTNPDSSGAHKTGVIIADALGHLIASTPGTGASRPTRVPAEQRSARTRTPTVTVIRQWFEHHDGVPALNIEFTVTPAAGSTGTHLEVFASAATADGGLEADPPAGAPVPTVLGFRHGSATAEGSVLRLPSGDESPVVVSVGLPDGVAAAVDIRPVAEA